MAANDLKEPEYTEEEASPIRKVIAKRLLESKLTAPHFYITVDVDMSNCIALRTELNSTGDRKISFNDIIIKVFIRWNVIICFQSDAVPSMSVSTLVVILGITVPYDISVGITVIS